MTREEPFAFIVWPGEDRPPVTVFVSGDQLSPLDSVDDLARIGRMVTNTKAPDDYLATILEARN